MIVFIDVDTQIDFMLPAGALYVPGAEHVIPAVAALNRFAVTRAYRLLSTMDAHAEDDPEFRNWPAHCVAGTLGQRKPASTVMDRVKVLPDVEGHAVGRRVPQLWIVGARERLDIAPDDNGLVVEGCDDAFPIGAPRHIVDRHVGRVADDRLSGAIGVPHPHRGVF